ncbi:hypothetical protein GCM10011409_35630 [Lentibacillus populi]|uniref:Uncharacterized protein n=1 Tax=Lentibacillus populi TaxID=1827502 RepID=A0A9W5TZY1_9BACI|nr:hypothetical protein GCM10011409_35630 [Lentibacillus populi]
MATPIVIKRQISGRGKYNFNIKIIYKFLGAKKFNRGFEWEILQLLNEFLPVIIVRFLIYTHLNIAKLLLSRLFQNHLVK